MAFLMKMYILFQFLYGQPSFKFYTYGPKRRTQDQQAASETFPHHNSIDLPF